MWLATLVGIVFPSGLLAQGGEWPTLTGAGIEYLSSSGFLQVSFSGQLDLEAMHVGGAAWGGLVKHNSRAEVPPPSWTRCTFCHQGLDYDGRGGTVLAHRLRVFTDIFLGDHLYSLVEVRSDRGHAPANRAIVVRVEQAFLRWTSGGGMGLQAGRFASPFGSYSMRHLSVADPFLRPPLPYEYRTVLVRQHVPRGAQGIHTWQDWPFIFRAPGAPPVWDVPYQVGAMAFGSFGPLNLRVAALGSAPSSDPLDWGFDMDRLKRPSWVVGARLRVSPELELGASYDRGPWMQEPYLGPNESPPDDSWRDFDQEIVSADFSYARGPMRLRAEAMLDLWEVPTAESRLRDLSYTAELHWDLSAGFSAAARAGLIDFGPFQPSPDAPKMDWDRDVYRLEGSLSYRLVRNAGVMLSAYRQHAGDATTFLLGVRSWWAF